MLLASCGTDLKLHNCPAYDLINVYRPADSTGQIRNFSWCKDGTWLALIPNCGNAEIVRTKDDVRLLQTILGVPNPSAAAFQRTTKRNLAMSTVSGSLLIYDIKAKSIKKRFVSSGSSVTKITMLDWCLKDTHLVTGSTDGQITVYSNTTNQKCSIFPIPESKSVSVVRFHSTLRSTLGAASDEGVVVVWDINNGRPKMCLRPHKAPVTDLVFSSQNNKLMVSVGLDRTFQCYDTNAGVVALSVLTDHPLSAVDMAPDGYTVSVGSSRGTICIYDLRNHEKPLLKSIAAHSGEITKILYQPYSLDTTDSFQIIEEKPVDTLLEPKVSEASVDSFTNMLFSVNEFLKSENVEEIIEQDNKINTNSPAGDSFLNGLDADDSLKRLREKSELSNLGLSDSVKKWLDAKKNLQISSSSKDIPSSTPAGECPMKSNDILLQIPKMNSSTPMQQNNERVAFVKSENLESNISPIMPRFAINFDELNKNVERAVERAVENAFEEVSQNVKKEVTEQISDLTESLSRFFMNLQLCFSKQFVGQERHMEQLFEHYFGANSSQAAQVLQLQQENEFLKSKINELIRQNNI